MIALPPLLAGAIHEIKAAAVPAVAATPVGLSGTVGAGVTLLDGPEGPPVPELFVAVTVKVYGVPFVRPVTVQVKAPVVVHGTPDPDGVTV
jgi:hypothetical protein